MKEKTETAPTPTTPPTEQTATATVISTDSPSTKGIRLPNGMLASGPAAKRKKK